MRQRVPGQERSDRSDDTQQVEDRLLQQRLHGPVRVRGEVAGRTRSVVTQSDCEEQADAEGYGGPVHPGLQESNEKKRDNTNNENSNMSITVSL